VVKLAFCFLGVIEVPDLGFKEVLDLEDIEFGVLGFEERRGREADAGGIIVAGAERGLSD